MFFYNSLYLVIYRKGMCKSKVFCKNIYSEMYHLLSLSFHSYATCLLRHGRYKQFYAESLNYRAITNTNILPYH